MQHKKSSLVAAILFLSIQFLFIQTASAQEEKTVIIHYTDVIGKNAAITASSAVVEEYTYLPMLTVEISTANLQALLQQEGIEFIEEDQVVQVQSDEAVISSAIASTDTNQWNLTAMNAATAWAEGLTGKGVEVAIIDSGISPHSDLKLAGGVSFLGESSNDEHGHGTHIAGIIAAQHNGFGTAGLAPNAQIYAVKVLDSQGSGDVSQVLKGIDWAIENDMDIINLSFGDLGELGPLKEAITAAYNHGILVVAASGNEGNLNGSGNSVLYPARYDEAIAVASINRNFNRSSWSATGPKNEFAAPGEDVYSTFLNGQYATKQGTSVAAPHITGMLALLKEKYSYLSHEELRKGLVLYTQDLGVTGRDEWYGYGLLKYASTTVTSQEAQLVAKAKEGEVSFDQARKAVNTMTASMEKLELTNALNEVQFKQYEQFQSLFVTFEKTPTTSTYDQLSAILMKIEAGDYKKLAEIQFVAAMEKLTEEATTLVMSFEKNKTVLNFNRAQLEVNKLPTSGERTKLQQRLESGLIVLAQPAMQRLEMFIKTPTAEQFISTQVGINTLPVSSLKTELRADLQKQVGAFVKEAKMAVVAYEKSQKLMAHTDSLKALNKVFDEKEKKALQARVNKVVNNQLKKAQTRVANYGKSKTAKNLQLAKVIVNELPSSKEKENLLKKLKWT